MDLISLIQKAKDSKFHLWKLNRILWLGIPFNKPHRFKITEISEGYAKILLPYRRSNYNHIKTIHACAMATCCEYATGLALGSRLSFREYRLIMKEMHVEYFYQGKMDAYCTFNFSEENLKELLSHLKIKDSHDLQLEVKCMDVEENHLSTATITWQVKPWSKTKSKKS